MKISVIIPSYLGAYKGAASNRDKKIVRAINSVLNQTYQDFEIYVIADGCLATYDIIQKHFYFEPKVECSLINKQPLWSGKPRNLGIQKCKGEVIAYLDIDDYLGVNHLKTIAEKIAGYDWIFFNDLIPVKNKPGQWEERKCGFQRGNNGTSNIAHRKDLGVYWEDESYQHDFRFIERLKRSSKRFIHIGSGWYHVCHIPKLLDI